MTKKIVKPVPSKDFLEHITKEQKELDIGLKMSRQNKQERLDRERKKTESEKLQQELEPIDENI